MARVTGPLHSDQASGQINGNMVFAKWKGRPYVRALVIPSNPKTAKQTGIRAMMKYLAQIWALGGPFTGGTWTAPALTDSVSAFNKFVGYNMRRWRNFIGITLDYPATDATTPPAIGTQTLTGAVGQITILVASNTGGDSAGIAIFRSTSAIGTCNWDNCVAVIPNASRQTNADPVGETYVDTPLAAGTYHYRTALLSPDGVIGPQHADGSTTAT